jgi:hypothetical protein
MEFSLVFLVVSSYLLPFLASLPSAGVAPFLGTVLSWTVTGCYSGQVAIQAGGVARDAH